MHGAHFLSFLGIFKALFNLFDITKMFWASLRAITYCNDWATPSYIVFFFIKVKQLQFHEVASHVG